MKGKGEVKLKYEALKGKSPKEIAKIIGYPGNGPVFADSANQTKSILYTSVKGRKGMDKMKDTKNGLGGGIL